VLSLTAAAAAAAEAEAESEATAAAEDTTNASLSITQQISKILPTNDNLFLEERELIEDVVLLLLLLPSFFFDYTRTRTRFKQQLIARIHAHTESE